MRRFFMAAHTHEYPFCSKLAAAWDTPWILYTAALFHDIARENAQRIAFLVQHAFGNELHLLARICGLFASESFSTLDSRVHTAN
jgi:hypothetical protein